MDRIQLILMIIFSCGGNILQVAAQTASTLQANVGKSLTLTCVLNGNFAFPKWVGPPSLTIYTNQDDTSGQINSAVPAFDRLSYAPNSQSLVFSRVFVNDSGIYVCSYTGLGDHTINLNVTEATTTPPPETTTTTTTTTTTPTSPSTPPPPPPSPDDDSDIIGIAVGVGVAVLLVLSVIVCLYCRHKKMKHKQEKTNRTETVSNRQMHNHPRDKAEFSENRL